MQTTTKYEKAAQEEERAGATVKPKLKTKITHTLRQNTQSEQVSICVHSVWVFNSIIHKIVQFSSRW